MVGDKVSAQLAEYCFNAYEALNTAIQGKNRDDLNESVGIALKNLERCVCSPWPYTFFQATPGLQAKSSELSGGW